MKKQSQSNLTIEHKVVINILNSSLVRIKKCIKNPEDKQFVFRRIDYKAGCLRRQVSVGLLILIVLAIIQCDPWFWLWRHGFRSISACFCKWFFLS